jgi:hypothetical protein
MRNPRYAWTGGATPREFVTRLNHAVDEGWTVDYIHHHPPFLGAILIREREDEPEQEKPEFTVLTFPSKED